MDINVGGLVSVIVFYFAILVVGIWAGWRGHKNKTPPNQDVSETEGHTAADAGDDPQKRQRCSPEEEESMLAGRDIGWIVGSFTMTATWVGGGFINGTAEAVYDSSLGLIWAQAPWGYALSLIIGGFLFARQMRSRGYVTMLDPLQDKFGNRMGGVLYVPALVGETFWSAAILAALGSTIAVILDIPNSYSVIISACIAVFYTLFGGLYSVAYTDVLQLICIFLGLWVSVPFVLRHDQVQNIGDTWSLWKGDWELKYVGVWIDFSLLLMFGGIPWQVYFQRVLSARSISSALWLSIIASFGCVVMAIPSVIIGAAGRSVKDWTLVGYEAKQPEDLNEGKLILPLVLQYLTPSVVSWVGLGAVSAAVMSSADSSVLSASSMFTRNVYKLVFRPKASDRELKVVLKVAIVSVGSVATVLALSVDSVFDLWVLCSDLVYVILFPNLLCCIYVPFSNSYGSTLGLIAGLFFRIAGGIEAFSVPPLIKYPFYNEEDGQLFPFRTLSMLICFSSLITISKLSQLLFTQNHIPMKYDLFYCFHETHTKHLSKDFDCDIETEHNNLVHVNDCKSPVYLEGKPQMVTNL